MGLNHWSVANCTLYRVTATLFQIPNQPIVFEVRNYVWLYALTLCVVADSMTHCIKVEPKMQSLPSHGTTS